MRVVVIGATGHIGGYLVPRLVSSGHDVVALSRGLREPYRSDPAWEHVTRVVVDRAGEAAMGTFGPRVAALNPDVVIDLVCFTPEEAEELVRGIRGHARLLVAVEPFGCTARLQPYRLMRMRIYPPGAITASTS